MRIPFLIFAFSLLSIVSYSQEGHKFFLDEFSISVNRTMLKDANTAEGYGFGFGLKHNVMPDKEFNILFGFEFNRTSQLKYEVYNGHFSDETDVTYRLNYLSVPFTARMNFGRTTKFFVETGFYMEFGLGGTKDGTIHNNASLPPVTKTFHDASGTSPFNAGPSIGIGLKIPLCKHVLIIETEYKYGMKTILNYADQMYNSYLRFVAGYKL